MERIAGVIRDIAGVVPALATALAMGLAVGPAEGATDASGEAAMTAVEQARQETDGAAWLPASDPPTDGLWLKNALIIGAGSALVGYYGLQQWWEDGFAGQFRTEKEGWFGQGTDYGGADKLGHGFFAYTTARLMSGAFAAVGNPAGRARQLGAWSALGVMMGVEILDGYSKKYRFSGEDALMNLAGVGMAYAMETHPSLDRLLDIRLLYRPSPGSGFEPGGDYSGQTYLLILKASGLQRWQSHAVVRYLELAVGYGSRGFGETPPQDPHRNVYVGLSLNVSEVLAGTVYRNRYGRSATQRATDLFLEFAQIPGTVVLKGHRLR